MLGSGLHKCLDQVCIKVRIRSVFSFHIINIVIIYSTYMYALARITALNSNITHHQYQSFILCIDYEYNWMYFVIFLRMNLTGITRYKIVYVHFI